VSDGADTTDFDKLGGEKGVRHLINIFTDRVYKDAMIGFFFHGKDQTRINEMEYRHAAEFLGGDVVYDGKPIARAHRSLGIMGGQFLRRRKILENTLRDEGVATDIIDRWLAHVDSFTNAVLGSRTHPGECDHDEQVNRLPDDKGPMS
jgi:truncated hemoglobin YjbI